MTEYTFGANILENLTTGMYRNPLILFREYIQNACDSIDKAVKTKVLPAITHGEIKVWLDNEKRFIEIKDNGLGIPTNDFQKVLGNIADSDKTLGEDKGFRGIGRLCGLAYCKKLIFYSKFKGESKISIMTCDAEKMRQLLAEHQSKQKKYLATEILTRIYNFEYEHTSDKQEHYFRIILDGIDPQNNNLLDILQVKEYLSFVAPVSYQNTFIYRDEIYNKAKELGIKIDEYSIFVNEEPIFKKYVTVLKEKTGVKYDDIVGVDFRIFNDPNGQIIAWMWVGVCQFKQAIPENNIMRSLRLRKENIQIGDENALKELFKEDRGYSYFLGEVFVLDNDLIPNSQRDYFNQNQARETLEIALKQYFDESLHKTYRNASIVNSGYKKIKKYEMLKAEYQEKELTGFAGNEHKIQKNNELSEAKKIAEKAHAEIQNKIEKSSPDTLFGKVATIIQKNRIQAKNPPLVSSTKEIKKSWRADKLARLSKQERKLVGRIYEIIYSIVEEHVAEKIVSKIEEELR
jgi:molecular chaperone HtpG